MQFGVDMTGDDAADLYVDADNNAVSRDAAVAAPGWPEVVASLAGGGTLGLLIPPSLSLLIYGALTETSIGQLFIAGIVIYLTATRARDRTGTWAFWLMMGQMDRRDASVRGPKR